MPFAFEINKNGLPVIVEDFEIRTSTLKDTTNHLIESSEEYQIKISLVNARFIKPLDTELLKAHALNHEKIITIEDNVIAGGFGSAVLEFLQESDIYTPVIRMGWPDKFIPHGNDIESLRKSNGLDLQGILRKLKPILNLTRPLCIE